MEGQIERLPNIVYKFAGVSGIDYILKNQTLSFTSIGLLNDVSEGTSDSTAMVTKLTGDFYRDYHKNIRIHEPRHRLASLSEIDFKNDLIAQGLTESVASLFHGLSSDLVERLKFSNCGVLSLTERNDCALMWAHYASEGKGFCVGFNANSKIISDSKLSKIHGHSVNISGLKAVTYSDKKPHYAENSITERIEAILFRKGSDWNYEREYRAVRPILNKNERTVENFACDDVVEIILGPRMSTDNRKACLDLMTKFPHAYQKIATISFSSYSIEIKDLPQNRALVDNVLQNQLNGLDPFVVT